MKFRVICKKTGEDVTGKLNPCLHHSGKLILLMANKKWREVDEKDYRIEMEKDENYNWWD